MTAMSRESAHVADQHITAVGNLGRRRGVTNRPHRARHDILARLHDEDPVYRILHPFGEPPMRIAPPSTIRHRRPRDTEHLRAQRHQGADVEYGRSSDNNSIIHTHEPTVGLKRTRRAELSAEVELREPSEYAEQSGPLPTTSVRRRVIGAGEPAEPISTRSTTDLEPEPDRSRRELRPISSRNRTDLDADYDRSRRKRRAEERRSTGAVGHIPLIHVPDGSLCSTTSFLLGETPRPPSCGYLDRTAETGSLL